MSVSEIFNGNPYEKILSLEKQKEYWKEKCVKIKELRTGNDTKYILQFDPHWMYIYVGKDVEHYIDNLKLKYEHSGKTYRKLQEENNIIYEKLNKYEQMSFWSFIGLVLGKLIK